MNNNAGQNALQPWLKTPDSFFQKEAEPQVLRRIWLKVPAESEAYLCAQKLKFLGAKNYDTELWRILVLTPVSFSAAGRPLRFQRKSIFMRGNSSGQKKSLFDYEAMMDAMWSYFEPGFFDPLRDHKDHFVQEMSRYAINLDRQDRTLCARVAA